MQESDIIQYLANVLSVARADGVMSPQEEAAAEGIRAELKAKKRDFTRAGKLAAEDSFELNTAGRLSEMVRNIEDMVYVGLADGDFSASEKKIVIQFAKLIGITQQQIDAVVVEAKKRVEGGAAEIECPACSRPVPVSSKFCPECGGQLEGVTDAKGTKLEFEYPSTGIAIEFAESSSASFHVALAEAQQAPQSQECERGRKKWYLAAWPNGPVADAFGLVEALKGLRNRKVYVDSEPSTWGYVFGFLPCFRQRQEAYRPTEYCFGVDENKLNIWGCRQARMDWTNWAQWFSYGRFRKKDVFAFDKARIRHELGTDLLKVRFCPCLRSELVKKALDLLPDEVRVSPRSGWEYNRDYQEGPNSMKIVEERREEGFTYTHEFFTSSVRPIGTAVGLDILKKALRGCAIADVDVKQLR